MPHDIVRARKNGFEYNTGRAQADRDGAEILDESPFDRAGAPRPTTRKKGRPVKPKVSVDQQVAEKKAAKSADQSDTAPSTKE